MGIKMVFSSIHAQFPIIYQILTCIALRFGHTYRFIINVCPKSTLLRIFVSNLDCTPLKTWTLANEYAENALERFVLFP